MILFKAVVILQPKLPVISMGDTPDILNVSPKRNNLMHLCPLTRCGAGVVMASSPPCIVSKEIRYCIRFPFVGACTFRTLLKLGSWASPGALTGELGLSGLQLPVWWFTECHCEEFWVYSFLFPFSFPHSLCLKCFEAKPSVLFKLTPKAERSLLSTHLHCDNNPLLTTINSPLFNWKGAEGWKRHLLRWFPFEETFCQWKYLLFSSDTSSWMVVLRGVELPSPHSSPQKRNVHGDDEPEGQTPGKFCSPDICSNNHLDQPIISVSALSSLQCQRRFFTALQELLQSWQHRDILDLEDGSYLFLPNLLIFK